MRHYTVDDFLEGDEVDVNPGRDDVFPEFTGRIVRVDPINEELHVQDEDDEIWKVKPEQCDLLGVEM